LRPHESRKRAAESRLLIAAVRLVRTTGETAGAGLPAHERRNGQFVLQVTGHPSYGLPWGQDRLVPIFLATLAIRQQSARITFGSAAEMLDTFGLRQGGSQYRRLVSPSGMVETPRL